MKALTSPNDFDALLLTGGERLPPQVETAFPSSSKIVINNFEKRRCNFCQYVV